jgi:hypothetical protein
MKKLFRLSVVLLVLATIAFAETKTVAVTVVSSESVREETGYSVTNATSNCVGSNCQATSTSGRTHIPVRYLYVVIDGQHIRLHAKQKFMTSYGKTLPPGNYQGEWKNSHTLTINYTDNDKQKAAEYEMAGVW